MSGGKTEPMVSVIIPHYGGEEILQECLESLKNTVYEELEIIVVDNNSQDDSTNIINTKFPNVKLIQSEINRGFAGGCNIGAQHAQGEYFLILNNDTIHDNNWILHLVHRMESDNNISSVQPKIKNYNKRDYFDYAGGSGGFMDKYCSPFARGRIFNTVEKDEGQYNNPCQIFWASGTAFITRKNIFNQIGGFDETLFAHMEEIDFHWKCQLLGYKIWVEPQSVVYHHGAITLPISSSLKTYLNYRNSLILLLTNYPLYIALKLFTPRFFMEFLSLIKEILFLRWNHALAIVKAWIWIFFHPSYLYRRRKNLQKTHEIDNIYKNSIVVAYYVLAKKTFTDLING
jgi:GT2 family glycosyltransferase